MMSRSRFTEEAVTRLPLSDGDWIEVRKDLNVGELKQLEAAGISLPVRLADGSVYTPIDWAVYEIDRVAIFLLDWSFKDKNDKVVPVKNKDGFINKDVIRALEPIDFAEVNDAITKHIIQRAKEKNEQRASMVTKTEGSPVAEPTSL